jgi:leucyl aminopeptidase
MRLQLASSFDPKRPLDVWILPFWEGGEEAADFNDYKAVYRPALADFKGKGGELAWVYQENKRLLLVGLGKERSDEAVRRALGSSIRAVCAKGLERAEVALPKGISIEASLEGVLLANYAFSYKSEKPKTLSEIKFIGHVPMETLDRVERICLGVHAVRDLVMTSADELTPSRMAELVKQMPLDVTVYGVSELERRGMGLHLAVGRAAVDPPCLIQASYRGAPESNEHTVLIGKGITYDTGGLSIKPTDGMLTMRCDMAGAAAVMGAVQLASELKLKVNVTALAPMAENAIGSRSFKLGDVYRAMNGKTVEINNTDAEGRLVLADAMAFAAAELKPSAMITIATLTGAAVVALGDDIAPLYSDDPELSRRLLAASSQTGELIHLLPLYKDYKEAFKSDVADLVNSGGREAGSMKAALFLNEFTQGVKWAHLDIAGPAFLPKPKFYYSTRGTGFGTRLLLDFLQM